MGEYRAEGALHTPQSAGCAGMKVASLFSGCGGLDLGLEQVRAARRVPWPAASGASRDIAALIGLIGAARAKIAPADHRHLQHTAQLATRARAGGARGHPTLRK
jgi:hypothetical protein